MLNWRNNTPLGHLSGILPHSNQVTVPFERRIYDLSALPSESLKFVRVFTLPGVSILRILNDVIRIQNSHSRAWTSRGGSGSMLLRRTTIGLPSSVLPLMGKRLSHATQCTSSLSALTVCMHRPSVYRLPSRPCSQHRQKTTNSASSAVYRRRHALHRFSQPMRNSRKIV